MSDPRLQSALNDYSVSVQRYKLLAALLPPSLRPPMLDRFQHRNNRWAVERRTGEVRKVIERMELQLKRAQPAVAAPSGIPVASCNPLDGALQDFQESAAAAENPGQQHPNMAGTHNDQASVLEKIQRASQEDLVSLHDSTADRDSVVTTPQAVCLSPDSHSAFPRSADTDKVCSDAACEPVDFSPADELDAIVRVGVVSPDAAIRMSRLIDTLKADGASSSVVKKVYTAFLTSVPDGRAAKKASGCISHGEDGVEE
ncbi:hypothetical protein FN846DRAFT_886175 [Sphaerosporella brunnea]|uniref:Uncharacterized protein n=1 Tax=Sphaerosporella brunnea TaxID=1250544 RepID=A0A5J5F9C7_9PEZI|nr:hypothetical protein FN846DRAFT_886175 [Sphaerosporella brunnea]